MALLVLTVSAESGYWFLQPFISFIEYVFPPAAAAPALDCNSPYIRAGDGCCLDIDENGVCDSDEAVNAASILPDCWTVKDAGERDRCFNVKALGNLDSSLCRNIADEVDRGFCYYDIALRTLDPRICRSAGGGWNISCTAFTQEDPGVCDLMAGDDRIYCRALATRNSEVCEDLGDGVMHHLCVVDSAALTRDPGVCDVIEYESDRIDCVYLSMN